MEFKQWLAEKHGHPVEFFPDHSYGYGIVEDGKIVFACVLQNFHFPGDILASYFADDPKVFFSKNMVRALRDIPFREPFNANRLTIILNTKHYRSVEVAIRYGFRGEGILSHHFGEEDATILSLLRPKKLEA
jgi:hypothetical protein